MAEASIDVRLEDRAGGCIAVVTVAHGSRLNSLNTAQIVRLRAAFAELAKSAEIRAVVLTGAGDRAFIGGADLHELGALCEDSARLFITRLHLACRAIRDCPHPVIARVNGFCLGAGLEIAASADMRVATDSAVFGMPEVQIGLPSVIEAALLPGLVGWGRTREMLLTGGTFPASEALAMGLVERVVPAGELDEAVEHWLGLILRAAPAAVRAQKALMNRWERVSLEEGVLAGIDALSDAYRTGEPQAAIGQFFAAKARSKETDRR